MKTSLPPWIGIFNIIGAGDLMLRLNIPFTDHRELEEIASVLSTGYLTQGPKTAQFEQAVADYVGCRHAFAMSSCTTALHLALASLDIAPGDEVLVADFTFPATANVVVQQGAVPVLVDICLDTLTIDPDDLARKVTPRTRAVIGVDAFGCAADWDAVQAVADRHNLPVIEDAATAIGTTYHDRFCGNLTTLGCFSFHPRKVITTGEGGMITTNDDALADRIRLLRSHGGIRDGFWFRYEAAGYNYRLSDIQGALGVAQMEKLSWLISERRRLAALLCDRLTDISGIHLPVNPAWDGHIYQSFVILLDDRLDRNRLIARMRELGVETTLGTYALHDQPFYQRTFGYVSGQLPQSHKAFCQTVTLPLYPQLTLADLDLIAASLRQAVEEQA
ncbi:MAG TPA: DegT/DnrJ/EryC1/StrS family aminotransferase [Anaerolineaceae bacterium]|nr:DegT/DnrJ/EryC1/StrS family aminotransferase [Anaerolineaceae bacterium]HNS36475.1 DegT/DnrJ/EryC1/StrS family aminotransferase [Anaerolineaceae bacterium]